MSKTERMQQQGWLAREVSKTVYPNKHRTHIIFEYPRATHNRKLCQVTKGALMIPGPYDKPGGPGLPVASYQAEGQAEGEVTGQ